MRACILKQIVEIKIIFRLFVTVIGRFLQGSTEQCHYILHGELKTFA